MQVAFILKMARCSLAPLEKSRRSHLSHVRAQAVQAHYVWVRASEVSHLVGIYYNY